MIHAIHGFVHRFRKPLKILIQVGVLVTIVSAIGAVGFVEYSAQPGFCDNCHIMEPYYESWATSSHSDVPCIQCHYAPGIKAEAMGKLQAANQVVKYITGTYGLKPWAEIEDAACLRSGCHSLRKIEGVVDYKGTRFDHTTHLGELRRGKQLRCTSCHSQIVQGDHVRVTESTCYLCHFKGRTAGDPVAGCTSCHASPPVVTSPAGFVVDHPQYVQDLVSCVSCHGNVATGSGSADQSRCFNCHNEPERLDQFANTTLVHRVHIAQRNVECNQCHTPIEHRLAPVQSTFTLDCGSCHQQVHEQQQRLYAGLGGHGTDNLPSAMFLANVSCRGCHELPQQLEGHESVLVAGEASCLSCHGTRYANILPSWQREMERRVQAVAAVVRGAERRVGTASVRSRVTVDSLLKEGRANLDLVRQGRSAHNIAYADQVLRATVELVREAAAVGGMAYRVPDIDLGAAVGENVCLQCHLNIANEVIEFRGRRFEHQSHVEQGGLSCGTCHSSLADHGRTIVTSSASCDACHHTRIRQMNCVQCHGGPGGAPDEAIPTDQGDFLHAPHQAARLVCVECHVAPTMSTAAVRCANCHEPHHQPTVRCLSCHRGEVKDQHTRDTAHGACTQCHTTGTDALSEWTREICTVCHQDKTNHNAPARCEDCHRMPRLRAASSGPDGGTTRLGRDGDGLQTMIAASEWS